MDSSVVLCDDGELKVVENRNLKIGDKVIMGRTEDGEEGILSAQYGILKILMKRKAINSYFRQGRSRETSYARDL